MDTRVGGIAGKLSFRGMRFTDEEISALVKTVPHRSPDGANVLHISKGALVALFLRKPSSSLDTESKSGSPAFSAVIHGDIHNTDEVLSKLGIEHETTQITTEGLIVASYIKWGDLCPLFLIGDYAFAIWDSKKDELFCARDAIGIKPFHYYYQDGLFVFGSELDQVVTHPDARRTLDKRYILSFANDRVIDRECTFFEKVKRLPAAHCMRVSAKGIRQSRYWNPENLPLLEHRNLDQYVDEFEALFSEAIRVRLPAQEEKLGAFLSGGVDSTSVLAGIRATQPNTDLQALSLAFTGLPCDESQAILANAKKLGIPVYLHRHKPVLHRDVQQLATKSQALPDSAITFAYSHLFDFAKKNDIQVVMGGWGADDWLGLHGGIYYDLLAEGHYALLAKQFGMDVKKSGGETTCKRILSDCVRAPLARQVKRFALAHKLPVFEGRANYVSDFDRVGWRSVSKWIQYQWLNSPLFAINNEMQELSAARHGVETRSPYNDRRIVEWGLRLGSPLFARSPLSKPVIRGLLCRIAPELEPESYLDPEGSPIYWQSLHKLYSDGDYDLAPLSRYFSISKGYEERLVKSIMNPDYKESASADIVRRQWNSYTVALWLEQFFALTAGSNADHAAKNN